MGWRREFGAEYAPAQIVIDVGDDLSWGNDAAPSFGVTDEEGENWLRIWANHPDLGRREREDDRRYLVDLQWGEHEDQFETDDPKLAVAVYKDWLNRISRPNRRRRTKRR